MPGALRGVKLAVLIMEAGAHAGDCCHSFRVVLKSDGEVDAGCHRRPVWGAGFRGTGGVFLL